MAKAVDALDVEDVSLIHNLQHSIYAGNKLEPKKYLRDFIKDVKANPTHDHYIKCIKDLTDTDLMAILNQALHKNSSYLFSKSNTTLLDVSVVLVCLRTLIKRWNGFPHMFMPNVDSKVTSFNLLKYLRANLKQILLKKKEVLAQLRNSDTEIDLIRKYETEQPETSTLQTGSLLTDQRKSNDECEGVKVECPYAKLKTLFVMDSSDGEPIINRSTDIEKQSETNFQLTDISFVCLFHWSFVSITLYTPEYKISYYNDHKFDYQLVKLHENFKPKVNKSPVTMNRRQLEGVSKDISPKDLIKYIYKTLKTETEIKHYVNSTAFCFDDFISSIDKSLKTNLEYTIPIKQRYYRYLGQMKSNLSGGPVISQTNQKKLHSNSLLNLRLQESIYPCFKLCITKPNPLAHKTSIEFSCRLCHIKFEGKRADSNLKQHLILEHGQEPDWFCAICEESFSMKKLTLKKWTHRCFGTPKHLSMTPKVLS